MGRGSSGRDENAGRSRSEKLVMYFASDKGLRCTIEAVSESCSRADGTTFSAIGGARVWGSWKMLVSHLYSHFVIARIMFVAIRMDNQATYRLKINPVSEQHLRMLENMCLPGKGISSISSAQDPKSSNKPCQPFPTPPIDFRKTTHSHQPRSSRGTSSGLSVWALHM